MTRSDKPQDKKAKRQKIEKKDKKTKKQKDKMTKRQKENRTKRHKYKWTNGPKREFHVVISGEFRTLTIFYRESAFLSTIF